MRDRAGRLGILIALLIVVAPIGPAFAQATSDPIAPCGPVAPAPYPAFADPPNALTWRAEDTGAGWAPAPCIGWTAQGFAVLTALAGRFRFDGSADDLLVKFGAQSAWKGIVYWSATDGRWETLIIDAAALDGPDPDRRRGDFTLAELKSGQDLYFLQEDNRSSDATVYRLRVVSVEPERLIVAIENVSAVSFLFLTLFEPGDVRSTHVFVKLEPGNWGYYGLSGARERTPPMAGHEVSYTNRAAAIYRHLAGIPYDQEPPMAP